MMISYRKHKEAVAMNILKTMLTLAQKIPQFFDFVCDLPTPFYLYANFHEWIPSFIEYYKEEMKKYCYNLDDYKRVLAVVEKIYPWYVEEFNKRLDLKHGKEEELIKPKPIKKELHIPTRDTEERGEEIKSEGKPKKILSSNINTKKKEANEKEEEEKEEVMDINKKEDTLTKVKTTKPEVLKSIH